MLSNGWVVKKNMLSIKAKNKQITFFFIKTLAQNLASTKNQRCIQNPVKHLIRGLIRRYGMAAGSLGWGYLAFVTVNQVFSQNILHSVTGFNSWDVQHFK